MKRIKQVFVWGVATISLCLGGIYAAIVYTTLDEDPIALISCIDANARWRAWTCKQALRYASFTPDQLSELNSRAGAQYPVMMDDPTEAEEILAIFLSRGVDINAVNQQANGWTALHIVVGDQPEKVDLLLKHGARTDIRDQDGRTPLELARYAQQRRPNNPYLPETIRRLEAQRKAVEEGAAEEG